MTKKLPLDPALLRQSAKLSIPSIPINTYSGSIKTEKSHYSIEQLQKVYYDMFLIREFENLLGSVKKEGSYQGINYYYPGPAHLSVGQEAASVGQCLALDAEDWIFGSHRSHGEILAKSLAAARTFSEQELLSCLETFHNGSVISVMEQHYPTETLEQLAEGYTLYTVLAEIFSRITGCNKGLGGSMHACFLPFGSMPNNAIVGASASIALGAALHRKINKGTGIVIANIGDAAMSCGPVWETLIMASMDQYHSLWENMAGAPPFLLNVFNNCYGMGGQTKGETMGCDVIARIGAGINPEAGHAERVDGFNPLAVADATRRKKALLLAGKGPVFMDTITYRFSGHSPSDTSSYRSREEVEAFREHDCLSAYAAYLQENNILSGNEIEQMQVSISKTLKRIFILAIDKKISPFVNTEQIESSLFSRLYLPSTAEGTAECLIPENENPRLQVLAHKKRSAFDRDGTPFSPSSLYTYRDAIFEAMLYRFYRDPGMIAFGEEVRDWGGAFGCYRGLTESLPYHRLFNAPIAEAGIVGAGIGYALSGGRAVVELMYCDFLGRAGDEVLNQMPKWQSMSGGDLTMPLVLRVSIGNKYGAQHSQDWTSLLGHIPGLQVVYPATPYDAKGMLNTVLCGSDPVVFFESQKLYGKGEEFRKEGVPQGYYEIAIGEPQLRRMGEDLSIICIGSALYTANAAADILETQFGIRVELIDLRNIYPLNYTPLQDSVKKTGKVVLISDACLRGSFMHTVASELVSTCFDFLDAPPVILGAKDWITPPADLEDVFFPQVDDIIEAVQSRIMSFT